MHIEYPTDLTAPGALDRLIAAHRSVFGDLRMEAEGDEPGGADGQQQDDPPSGQSAVADVTLEDVVADLGLTPDQLKGRLEASKKWEQRAKANVPHEDYAAVKAELDAIKQANESDADKAVREAREQAATDTRAAMQQETVQAMARMALRTKGVKDEDITAFVTETNLSVFVNDDGQVDDERLMARVDRYAGTAGGQKWPATGQGRRGGAVKESGSDLYDRYYGTKK